MASKFLSYFKGIRAGTLLIAAVAAIVSKKVVKTELVPDQLYWLSDAGVLAAMAALAAIPSVNPRPRRRVTKVLLGISVFTFGAVVAIRASLVQEVEINRETRRYLVGYSLTESGKTMEKNCMEATHSTNVSHLPRAELISRCSGPANIPDMYGSSYTLISIVYLVSYLAFLGAFVLLVGGVFEPAEERI